MSWKDDLRPASFRGVPFYVTSSESAHGRNTVVHKYPRRRFAYVEDLGLDARRFLIDAHLVGKSYNLQRDALVAALEREGAGELVHPYRGTLQAIPGNFSVREDVREGGMCVVAITFLEAGETTSPSSTTSPERAVSRTADKVGETASTVAPRSIDLVRRPEFVRAAAETSWTDSLAKIKTLTLSDLEAVQRLIGEDGQKVLAEISTPVLFARDAVQLIAAIAATAAGDVEAARAYLELARDVARRVAGASGQSLAAIDAATAVHELVRQAAIAEAARAAAAATSDSYEAAIALRDEVLDELDLVSLDASDEVCADLADLRRLLVGAMPPPDEDLPHLAEWTPPATTPTLVIAYRLYDDVDRADEIALRNDLPNPGQVPGGQPIEVLVDAS